MRMFQITEDDLSELERVLPELCEAVTMRPDATPRQRTQFRQIQKIVVNVRWNYGPPGAGVEIIPADDLHESE